MALRKYYGTLRKKGTAEELLKMLLPLNDFHEIVGLEEKYLLDEKYK
jgi:hypothetical protein